MRNEYNVLLFSVDAIFHRRCMEKEKRFSTDGHRTRLLSVTIFFYSSYSSVAYCIFHFVHIIEGINICCKMLKRMLILSCKFAIRDRVQCNAMKMAIFPSRNYEKSFNNFNNLNDKTHFYGKSNATANCNWMQLHAMRVIQGRL